MAAGRGPPGAQGPDALIVLNSKEMQAARMHVPREITLGLLVQVGRSGLGGFKASQYITLRPSPLSIC